ncbi:MAG: glycosyltransferase [Acidobacteria bacterium]|nr:MAG: glycosyltransferase [Acidobacteriota bacterium]
MMQSEYLRAVDDLRESSGVVIPAFFPSATDIQLASDLLTDTALGCCSLLGSPARVCISVDGENPAADAARRLQTKYGLAVVVSARNKGKLGALHEGLTILVRDESLRYFLLVDQDGDHFPNELPNFVRAARHVASSAKHDRVLVLGRRSSRHHPMGYLRGELEELADRMLVDCLQYRAVREGVPLNLQFALLLDEFPDFHSGYKLLTRPLVTSFLENGVSLEGLSEDAVYRHAVEAVLTVEAVLSGGIIVSVARSTFNEQPITAFGQLNRCRLVADKIIWPARRLRVPAAFIGQWFENHLARLRLATLAPGGKEELIEIRNLVRQAFDLPELAREIEGPPFL